MSLEGNATISMQETFWHSYYGKCIDQFVLDWMFSITVEEERCINKPLRNWYL